MQVAAQPWGFLATLAWTALALGLAIPVALPAADWAIAWLFSAHPGRFVRDDIALTVGVLVAVAVLAFAARRAGWQPRDYFGLTRSDTRHLVIGIAAVAVAQAAFFGLLFLSAKGIPTPAESRLNPAGGVLAVLLPLFTAIIVGPIGEEVIFRGFLYRGLAASRLGIGGAIVHHRARLDRLALRPLVELPGREPRVRADPRLVPMAQRHDDTHDRAARPMEFPVRYARYHGGGRLAALDLQSMSTFRKTDVHFSGTCATAASAP